jgi:hypothetical protein
MADKPFQEPSSEEYQRIAKGFDAAAAGMISAAGVWLRRAKWVMLSCITLLVLAYIGEDLWLRWKIRNGRETFGSVMVTRYYAIHKKSGKIEYDSDEPVAENCVNSAFPHFGVSPCWYVQRNRHPIVDR